MNMSNKEILEQHNAKLSENSTDLGSILETINKLPTVEEVKLQEKSVIPTTETQEVVADEEYTGLSKVTVEKITGDTLEVTPNTQQQSFSGVYTDVKVAGDENLIAENIKKDVEIFGVVGAAETGNATDTKITSGIYLFYKNNRIDYINELLSLCDKINTAESMFAYCTQLTELNLSKLDTSNATSMYNMFTSCNALTSLDVSSFDTSKVTSMYSMFDSCRVLTSLDVSSFDTTNVTDMKYMFRSCNALTSLDVSSFDTSKITDMQSMFASCYALTSLDLSSFDTTNVTSMRSMFYECLKLQTLSEVKADACSNARDALYRCAKLTNFGGFKNIGKGYTQKTSNYSNYSIGLSQSTELTHESLMNVINNLYDLNLTYNVANGGTLYTQQLVIGSTNMAKLSADEIAIATNKGWSVS
jgi:surface protein